MAEALVSGILVQLTKLAIDEAKENVKLLTNVKKEVQKIILNLRAIRVVLEDAEEREFGDKPLQFWLELLKEVAFRMEDVLDDCKVALLTLRSRDKEGALKAKKVLSCISLCFRPSQGVGRYEIASRIREINSSLDEIAKQKNNYGLAAKPERKQPRRVESTSFGVVLNLHGRDKIREDIIKCLLSESEEKGGGFKTISVLGMGGVGKTALAQLIYHDGRIKERFGNNSIWVCVSDYFDLRNVAIAIIEGLEHQMIPTSYQSQLQQLLERISSSIQRKKFFLVLDDVWEQDFEKWRSLIHALKDGAPGSRVLLTTRKKEVARMLKYSQVFPLEKLSDDHCWMILSELAFDGRDEEERRELEDIGKTISNRCKGLPLAAITLGKLLGSKSNKEEWESILNSEIWKLNVAEQEIFTPLLLSYYDLPSPIRRCFKFCVLKLKDSNYLKDDLIHEWASQGYLELDGNANLESTGADYFNFLASRSFFQDVKTYRGAIVRFKIHDIVHDFGQYLSKDDIVMKEVNPIDNLTIDLSSSRIRHLSLFSAKYTTSPTSVNGAEKLHTLTATRWINETSLCNIFNQAKQLRMICLDCRGHVAKLSIPEEIGNLIHLNHLSFTNIIFETLPESMSKLCNLQYLYIQCSWPLKRLPYWIGKFVDLRFLGTISCGTKYPTSVARLTNLRVLIGIKLNADWDDPNEFTLGDLEKMVQLRRLWIQLEGSVIDAGEVVRAKFVNKSHLNNFKIFLGTEMKGREDYVIQALNLPSQINLRFSDGVFFGE